MNKLVLLMFSICNYIQINTYQVLENKTCEKVPSYINFKGAYSAYNSLIIFNDDKSDERNWRSELSGFNIYSFKNTCVDIAGTKYVSEYYPYVINFRVDDFYNNFNETIYGDFIYFGENDDSNNHNINSVKLVSARFCDDYPRLCDKIIGIPESAVHIDSLSVSPKPRKILHCTDDTIKISIKSVHEIIKSNIANCEANMNKYSYELEAVMSPEPFHIDAETIIPTAFYGCLIENDKNLAPFTNLARKFCNNIEYAYLKLLNKMAWQRVAILSDFSELNDVFEKRLTKLFDKRNIIYGLERCTESEDDLKKMLKKLVDIDARIIILNTDKVTTEELFKQAKALNMLDNGLVWITKNFNWPFHLTSPHIPKPLVFNISPSKRYGSLKLEKFHASTITPRSKSDLKKTTDKLLEAIDEDQTEFIINGPKGSVNIYKYITDDVKTVNDENELQNFNNIRDMKPCTIKTKKFYNPCNDFELYLILGVLLIFSIALLIVSTFFMELDTIHQSERESQRLL